MRGDGVPIGYVVRGEMQLGGTCQRIVMRKRDRKHRGRLVEKLEEPETAEPEAVRRP
jgi:hypothetical protein